MQTKSVLLLPFSETVIILAVKAARAYMSELGMPRYLGRLGVL